ncbi:MAG: TRZ/ATZ family hydrolase [Burkholderiales bacterium]
MISSINKVIHSQWVVPVEPPGVCLEKHCVAIDVQGRITAVLPSGDARIKFPQADHVELSSHVLLPGLINLHSHAAMTVLRGLADDLALMAWLNEHIWPAEQKHANAEMVYDGTLLACAEMLLGGVTSFNDMYFFPDASVRAALSAGMRLTAGIIAIEFANNYASGAADCLHKGLATRDTYNGEPLISFSLAPHAPYSVSDTTFRRIVTMAEQLDLPIHIHLHETLDEIKQSLTQFSLRPLARLQNLGMLGPNFIAVHAVHLEQHEIDTLAKLGCHVAHCPASNLKLASGIAPIARLLDAGINIGIGTDGAVSNNKLDMFGEMRLAALLAKGASGRADVLPAHQALHMATLNAAMALGKQNEIGSLVAGKAADMIAIDLSTLQTAPCYDVISHLVYAVSREQATHVWVNGELRVENGRLSKLDATELLAKARYWQKKIQAKL